MSQRVLLLGVALLLLSASSALAVNCQCDYTLTKPTSTTVRATVSASCDSGNIQSTTVHLSRDGSSFRSTSSSGTFASMTVSDPSGLQEYCVFGDMLVSGGSSFITAFTTAPGGTLEQIQVVICGELPLCKNL